MRKFLVLAVLVFLAWWLFVRPGSTEFGCEAAAATAHAASDDCPSSAEAAAGNSSWAADRMNSISDSKLTTGLLYDSDGTEHALTSGYDDDADRVTELLDELGLRSPSPVRTRPQRT